jgi:ABC-2 type transport system permease protein
VNVRAALEALRTGTRRTLADRGGFVVSTAFYLVIVVTVTGLWRVAVRANGGHLAGYSAAALTWYLVTSEATTVSMNPRLIEELGTDVASGTIAVELLRPASVLALRVAAELGRALPKVVVLWCAGAVMAGIVAGAPPRPAALVLLALSLPMAVLASLLGQHAVGALSFWLREAGTLWFLWLKAVFLTGGLLIPLELLPPALEKVAFVLPFWAMAYAPARIAAGHVDVLLLAGQAAWVGGLGVLATLAFRSGERRLQVVGG